MDRRRFLLLAGGTALGVAGCASSSDEVVRPSDPVVGAVEARRATSGSTVRLQLRPAPTEIDLAGVVAKTWAFAGAIPGKAIRAKPGDEVRIDLINDLPEATAIHWHGLSLRNDMDGVHDLTQEPVAPGDRFLYHFKVPHSGTHWFHPHTGTQLDRGLYAPFIVDEPGEAGDYDDEVVVVLDDWLDGVRGATPDAALAKLTSGGGMAGMNMGASDASDSPLGADGGDVTYPYHLANGVPAADRQTVGVQNRSRTRIRLINAASDTAYRVACTDQQLTVTHADGWAVMPVRVDGLIIGMGERYDLLVDAGTEPVLLVASAEGKKGQSEVILRPTGSVGDAPPTGTRPKGLDGKLLAYGQLRPADSGRLERREVDLDRTLELTGSMRKYSWGIDGRDFADRDPVEVRKGQRVRLTFVNRTTMWHPMHLHGHTFALGDASGPRKDTVNVMPGKRVAIEFDADNPGQWMLHCHNTYHLETGMASTVDYLS